MIAIKKSVLSENCVLVSFDVVNMFPHIDNKSGLLSVKEALTDSNFNVVSTQCIVNALEICLTCNNSTFNHQHFYIYIYIHVCMYILLIEREKLNLGSKVSSI